MIWGHSENGGGLGVPEELADHITRVTEFAELFGTSIGFPNAAKLAALLHDIGKYSPKFQNYVRGEHGAVSPDHWSAGARIAISAASADAVSRVQIADAVRLAIESHHSFLGILGAPASSAVRLDKYLQTNERPKCNELAELCKQWCSDGFSSTPLRNEKLATDPASAMLDARMVFSCLVDADFLATEGHFNGDSSTPYRPRSLTPPFDFRSASDHVGRIIGKLPRTTETMQAIRSAVGVACHATAEQPQGLFTLTAPTGAGKTLAMLRFAFEHAARHGMRRVVFVMPFLTIIDQTVRVLRATLQGMSNYDERWILEDHSLANATSAKPADEDNSPKADELTRDRRLAAENWDAPIVLTSSVKCLEGLHANRPSACRKLHRLSNSVVLFDEVQTLPPKLASLTLATLTHLAHRFHSSVVFSTATQPAFDLLESNCPPPLPTIRSPKQLSGRSWSPLEIVPNGEELFRKASGRTKIHWRMDEPMPLSRVAATISASDLSTLGVVNFKRHARELYDAVAKESSEAYHLSTSMCPAHRERTLASVQDMLANGRPVKLISTQCVEAGVDFSPSFQEGWRSFAPLDSIAQAAGRVNRSFEHKKTCDLVVFHPEADGPLRLPGYSAGIAALRALLTELRDHGRDLNETEIIGSPKMLRRYYQNLYGLSDQTALPESLLKSVEGLDFEGVRKEYRIIDQNQRNVLVPFDTEAQRVLLDQYNAPDKPRKWTRDWIRTARPHTVGVYEREFEQLQNFLQPLPFGAQQRNNPDESDWWFLSSEHGEYYSSSTGLLFPNGEEFLCV